LEIKQQFITINRSCLNAIITLLDPRLEKSNFFANRADLAASVAEIRKAKQGKILIWKKHMRKK